MPVIGTHPAVSEQMGIVYCAYHTSGTVCCIRSTDGFAHLMTWGTATSAVITTGADDVTPGLLKYGSSGRAVLAVVPKAGTHYTYISTDDGATWSQVS